MIMFFTKLIVVSVSYQLIHWLNPTYPKEVVEALAILITILTMMEPKNENYRTRKSARNQIKQEA